MREKSKKEAGKFFFQRAAFGYFNKALWEEI
jgi:hypothetical protein